MVSFQIPGGKAVSCLGLPTVGVTCLSHQTQPGKGFCYCLFAFLRQGLSMWSWMSWNSFYSYINQACLAQGWWPSQASSLYRTLGLDWWLSQAHFFFFSRNVRLLI